MPRLAAPVPSLLVLAFACSPTLPALAAEIPVASRPDAVTVFPDGASITRRLAVTVPAGEHVLVLDDLPLTADPASLRLAGAGTGSLVIGAVDARQPRPTERRDPALVQRLEALKDERQALDDRIAAERVRKRAAEALVAPGTLAGGERGLVIAEARQALAAAHEETLAADRAIRQAEQAQRGLDRSIAEIEAQLRAQPPRRLEARITVEASAPFRGELTLTYAVRQARWTPVYDARMVTTAAKPQLELVRRAEIRQQSGEDWTDVALTVSTARVARGGAAPALQPLVLRFHDPEAMVRDRAASGAPRPLALPAPAAPAREQADTMLAGRAVEQEAVAEVGAFQTSFAVPGRAQVASGEGARTLRLAASTLEPDLVSRVVPSLDVTAFLEARFRHGEDVPLMAGPVSLYRDGVFAGRGQIGAATREDEVKLGFGPDDLLRVEHQVVRRTDGSAGIISSARTEEREFRFVLRNGAQVARRVVVEDRVPVSEQQEITVEPLAGMTAPTTREPDGRRGIVAWSLDVPAGATRDIRHGWRLRWPADKRLQQLSGRS